MPRTKEQKKAYDKAYYEKNREKLIARSQAYHEAHRDAKNARQREYFKRKGKWSLIPGWDKERFEQMLMKQDGKCQICENVLTRPVRDHDHETNKARGLLCDPCNRMLGAARDNPDTLANAAKYINYWKGVKR